MRVLITGAGGFVGDHLARHIANHTDNPAIYGTVFRPQPNTPAHIQEYFQADLRDYARVLEILNTVRPDYIFHLAAQAFVPRSFEEPWETLENNILAQLNIFKACLDLALSPRMMIVSSAEIYGAIQPEQLPLTEQEPFRPANPYSVSKVAQDMLALQYFLSHRLPVMRARPFNHIGPGQSSQFVAPAFAEQIARIEAGLQDPVLKVGNLEAKRDFTDVRDIVRAYHLIVEKGNPGEAYNIASNKSYSIQQLLDTLLHFTHVEIEVQVDPERLRPIDVPEIRGDYSLLHQATGWQPQIPFEQTLHDILEGCRQRIHTTT